MTAQPIETYLGHGIFMEGAALNCPSLKLYGFHWQDHRQIKAAIRRALKNKTRRGQDQARRDLGLVKVRGNLGGTYWE